jgi:hypothetical protein
VTLDRRSEFDWACGGPILLPGSLGGREVFVVEVMVTTR